MGIVQRQSLKNSLIIYIGIAIGAISIIFLQPRLLTKEEIGLTKLLFSFSSLIATLIPFGANIVTLKYFPRFRNKEIRHQGFFGFVFTWTVIGLLVGLSILYLCKPFLIQSFGIQSPLFIEYLTCVFPLILFLAFVNLFVAYSHSIFLTSVPTLINDIFVRIVSIVLFFVYFSKLITLHQFIWLFVSIYGLQCVGLFYYLINVGHLGFRFSLNDFELPLIKEMLTFSAFMSIAAISSLGIKYLDGIMLATIQPINTNLKALDIVGIYSIAMFIATFVEAPLNAMDKILTPKIADAWQRNDLDDIAYNYSQSSRYLLIIGGFLFLLINLNIDSLFQFFPDKDFSLGKQVVFIISLGTLVNMSTGSNDAVLWTSKKFRYLSFILLFSFALSFFLYKIFIPLFGMNGAAIATCVVSLFANISKLILIWVLFKIQPLTKETLLVVFTIVAVFLAFNFIQFFDNPILNIGLKSTLISIIYLGIIYYFNLAPLANEMIKKNVSKLFN